MRRRSNMNIGPDWPLARTRPRVGKRPQKILKVIGPFPHGGDFVLIPNPTHSRDPREQDPYLMVVVNSNGVITHDYGTHVGVKGAEAFYKNRIQKTAAINWSTPKTLSDWKKDRNVGKVYGAYIFYSMHHGSRVPDKSSEYERALDKEGFNLYGAQIDLWPEAKKAYLTLCRKYRVEPEAV